MNEIKDIRTRVGMTQEQFGEFLGIPRRTIQNWEGGQRKCPDYVVALIWSRIAALHATPCDVCTHNPERDGQDGKSCVMCPARGKNDEEEQR